MHRLAAALAPLAAASMLLCAASAAHADEPPAPSAPSPAPSAPDAQRPAPTGEPAQEGDAEEPAVTPAPALPERQLPMAPPPADATPRFPAMGAPAPLPPTPPPMPPSYYQQQQQPERTLAGRTHNLLLPTGDLLPDGQAEITTHDFVYYRGAIALSDQLELDFSTPIVPAFAQAGLRFGVTPRSSRFKLVVGADVYVSLIDDSQGDSVLAGTVTAAYQTDRFNLHATGMFFYSPSGDDAVGLTSIGATLMMSSKVALFGEVSEVMMGDRHRSDVFYTQMAGIKLLGDQVDVDLGIMLFTLPDTATDGVDNSTTLPLPVVSATKHF